MPSTKLIANACWTSSRRNIVEAGQIASLVLGDGTPQASVRDLAHRVIAIGSVRTVRVSVPGDAMNGCETSQAVLASEKHQCRSDDHEAYEAYHQHDREYVWTQNHFILDRVEIGYFSQRVEHNTMVPIQGQQPNILVVNFLKERWHLEVSTFCRSHFFAEFVIAWETMLVLCRGHRDLEDVLSQR